MHCNVKIWTVDILKYEKEKIFITQSFKKSSYIASKFQE